MTFVVLEVNTDVVRRAGTITNVVDVHQRLVNLIVHLMKTPGPNGERRSQQTIADATKGKVSQSAISTYLSGTRRAKIDSAIAIGRAHGVRDAYFSDEGSVFPDDYVGTRLDRDDAKSYPAVEAYLSDDAASERPPVSEEHAAELRRFKASGEVTIAMVAGLHAGMIARDKGKAIATKAQPLTTGRVPEGKRKVTPGKKH